MTINNLQDLEKFFVGYTDLPMTQSNAHPRFNIFKLNNNGYHIELAVPGLSKDQISVTHHKETLSIKGEKTSDTIPGTTVHRGFSGKGFERSFKVDSDLEVSSAELVNGVLQIVLNHSEASKPVQISIG